MKFSTLQTSALSTLIAVLSGYVASANDRLSDEDREATRTRREFFLSSEASRGTATSPSDLRNTRMSVAELRQARGWARARQREARMEYYQWMGYVPSRPNQNWTPMALYRPYVHQYLIPAYRR